MNLDDLLEAFEMMPDWEDRYELIAELGAALPALPEDQRTERNLVKGCNTRAWLIAHLSEDQPPLLVFDADAETVLVRGLMAVLLMPFRDKTPQQVLDTDAQTLFAKLGIEAALSPSRRMGMYALLERVRALAAEFEAILNPPTPSLLKGDL